MKKAFEKGALFLTTIVVLHLSLEFIRNYGINYGSYHLRNSYYGMINNENSYRDFQYVNLTFQKLSKVKDRLWVRYNYSDFRFREPSFADERSRKLWYKNGENQGFMKAQPLKDYFSEVLFLRNGTISVDKFCGYKGATDWITQAHEGKIMNWFPSFIHKNWYPILVPLLNRDGSTFQHFTDGTLHRIVQILPLIQNRTVKLLIRRPRDSILYDILKRLRISSDQLVYRLAEFQYGADLMIHSCIPETLHPALWQEARRLIGVPKTLSVPYKKAFVIIITRDGCVNCGRRILNWKEIISMLETRYGSDVIKVFKGPQTLDGSLEIFGNSRIILGPHGGGLYNMNFAPHGTTVIEFMPTKEDGNTDISGHQIFWKVANVLYHDYWRVCLPPGENKNMIADLDILSALLDTVDGKRTT